jgi:hypothetical protein
LFAFGGAIAILKLPKGSYKYLQGISIHKVKNLSYSLASVAPEEFMPRQKRGCHLEAD